MYVQRSLPLPGCGQVVIFDRSLYNRAGVERVMGFCTPEETKRFQQFAPRVEKAMVDSGIILLKCWLEVSRQEQSERLESRMHDGRKRWKLAPMDLKSCGHWFDYSRARDAMILARDTDWAPWYLANTDDKKRGRLNIISHLLAQVSYEAQEPLDVKLRAVRRPTVTRSPTTRSGLSRLWARRRKVHDLCVGRWAAGGAQSAGSGSWAVSLCSPARSRHRRPVRSVMGWPKWPICLAVSLPDRWPYVRTMSTQWTAASERMSMWRTRRRNDRKDASTASATGLLCPVSAWVAPDPLVE